MLILLTSSYIINDWRDSNSHSPTFTVGSSPNCSLTAISVVFRRVSSSIHFNILKSSKMFPTRWTFWNTDEVANLNSVSSSKLSGLRLLVQLLTIVVTLVGIQPTPSPLLVSFYRDIYSFNPDY